MRPPRLTIRILIVVVALATVAVGAVQYRCRSAKYEQLAALAAEHARFARRTQERYQLQAMERPEFLTDGLRQAQTWKAIADRHAHLRNGYLRCARYPWLSPPADEPETK